MTTERCRDCNDSVDIETVAEHWQPIMDGSRKYLCPMCRDLGLVRWLGANGRCVRRSKLMQPLPVLTTVC